MQVLPPRKKWNEVANLEELGAFLAEFRPGGMRLEGQVAKRILDSHSPQARCGYLDNKKAPVT